MSNSIFEGWIYDHSQYKVAYDSLVEEIERVLSSGSPFVFPVLGDSRSGKTALLKDVEAHFCDRLSASGHKRVLFVPMPTAASNLALAVRIIQTLIGDIQIKGKVSEILDRAKRALQSAGVLVLLVDETNHLVEKRTSERAQTRENRQTADWFKELGDLAGISVVISGLSHVSRMYSDNDQLENRGLTGITFYPYAWTTGKDRKEFEDVVLAGITHLKESGWKFDVTDDLVTKVAYYGGGGYVGKARDFLARIETISVKSKHVDLKILANAYQDKYRIDAHGNPVYFQSIDDIMLQKAYQAKVERARSSGGRRR